MKICPNCGAQEDGVFCTACGSKMPSEPTTPPTQKPTPNPTPQHSYTPTPNQPPYGYYPPQSPSEEPMSVGGWIGRLLIPCIPVVGWIIYLVMLFVWMGDNTKQESFRNWAKAQLILMAIGFGLAIVMGVLMVLFTMGVASNFAQY